LAANEHSTDGSTSQQSNPHSTPLVIRTSNTYVEALNRVARNSFGFTMAAGSQK
jgi:hypothetical protein